MITEPTSWISPMVPVPINCPDMRRFKRAEQVSEKRTVLTLLYQLPTADELLARLRGTNYFKTLDAVSGFWQIPLSEDCSTLTTFIIPFGRYKFTRLPFGITSRPEVFHRIMQQVVSNQPGTACYIDDILVWGATVEEHDYRLRQVLSRCREAGIKLNPSKCKFRATSVKFFGHVLNAQGVHADNTRFLQ